MASKIHRRTPSNDGTVETILSSLAPSRSSSNSSSTSNSSSSMEEQQRDIESSSSSSDNHNTKPLLPTRGRSAAVVASSSGGGAPSPAALETTVKKISGSAMKAITACLNYSFCSVSMILVNKSLASRYVDRSICRYIYLYNDVSRKCWCANEGTKERRKKGIECLTPLCTLFLDLLPTHQPILYTATII